MDPILIKKPLKTMKNIKTKKEEVKDKIYCHIITYIGHLHNKVK